MTNAVVGETVEDPPKKGKKGLLFGLIGAVLLGAGGFYATYSGLILGGGAAEHEAAASESSHSGEGVAGDSAVFVTLPSLTISLGRFANSRHLRFSAAIEVAPGSEETVTNLSPRILDVLNTYLRAVSEVELEDPASMNRIRAQMLRRVQVVAGEENVRDLLITEFVLN